MKKNLLQKWYVHQQLELTHIIRIMKLSVFFIFVFLFQLQAGNVKSQEVRVTLSKSSLTFGELMREIEKQTNYLFMYRDAEIDLSQKIEVKNTSATVKEILTTALRNKKLTYKFSNNYISLYVDKEKAPETMVTQQERKIKIKGVVIDQVGEPIIGANISLKGQPGTGDITDIEGNFTLEVPEKAVLVISYIGYLTQEIPVNGKASFNIQMKEDTKTLDEVVVVGYGSQKKQTVTASASTLKVSSLKNVPTANLASSLGGRVSGVLIQQTGGSDGVRDYNLLDSALETPFQSFGGDELYPTIQAKAVRLGYGLIKNHCMIDGNKRIGTHAMLVFLALNGIEFKYTQKELYETILDVAAGKIEYEDLLQWVLNHQA